MTLKSEKITSDFDLFNEILNDVKISKDKEKRLSKDSPSSDENEDDSDTEESGINNSEKYEKDSSSSSYIGNSLNTLDTEDNTHYADSDFESITSNDDSDTDYSDDGRSRKSVSSGSSSKKSIKSDRTSKKSTQSGKNGTIDYSNNTQDSENEGQKKEKCFEVQLLDDIYTTNKRKDEFLISTDIDPVDKESEPVKSKKGMNTMKKKNILNKSQNGFLVSNQNMYNMYRHSNFPIMDSLLQGNITYTNQRIRSKSAAPSTVQSRDNSCDKPQTRDSSHVRSLSRGQTRPQSLYGRGRKINLSFCPQNVSSKIENKFEDSKNPVLLSWLENKKKLESFQQKLQKEERKLQRYEDKQRFLQAYQRTMDSSEKVKQWMENKKKKEKQKRFEKNEHLEKLKLDTIEHQRRLVSPMFIKNRFCEMNPAVIDNLKQKANRKLGSPRKGIANKLTSYEAYSKSNRETFFKYYLNDPVCPKGYASLRSFTDSVLQDAAKELQREINVKEGRLRRQKTALQLHELKQTSDKWLKDVGALTTKPPVPPTSESKTSQATNEKRPPVQSNEKKDRRYGSRVISYDEWMEEKKRLRSEKLKHEKMLNMDAKLEKQTYLEEGRQKQKKLGSKLKRNPSFKSARFDHSIQSN